jgi:sterol desaturase/sphingolipid hydroxylase (fatty acid hydroxylase superfamily)
MKEVDELKKRPGVSLRKVSNASTSCSTPPPHDLMSIIHSEETRYIRKGYGLISASVIAVSFFYFSPILMQIYWPAVLEILEQNKWILWKFVIISLVIWHAFWVLASNLFMWTIYHLELPFFERYKINSAPWPWYQNEVEWRDLLKKSILICTFNSLVSLPILLFLSVAMTNFEVQYAFSYESLPSHPLFIANIVFCMICEDFAFHFSHRFLHWKVIYPYIHKLHHTYNTTVGIAAEYSHPVEFIFGAAIPGALGGMILGKNMHFCTLLMWTVLRIFETLDGHCGYEFSWSPYRLMPFSTSATYHDFHHSHNFGNYSS